MLNIFRLPLNNEVHEQLAIGELDFSGLLSCMFHATKICRTVTILHRYKGPKKISSKGCKGPGVGGSNNVMLRSKVLCEPS